MSDGFELSAGTVGGLTAGELAAAWGCSDQTIFNYTAGKVGRRIVERMPHVVEPSDGITRYDRAACEAWRASNVVGVGAGGEEGRGGEEKAKWSNGQIVKWSNEGGGGGKHLACGFGGFGLCAFWVGSRRSRSRWGWGG